MALLLEKLLTNSEKYKNIVSELENETPPEGIDAELWANRHELPLQIINYLRDRTSRTLSLNSTSQTPSKLGRPAKYDYVSPIKSVRKDAGSHNNRDVLNGTSNLDKNSSSNAGGKKSSGKEGVKLFSGSIGQSSNSVDDGILALPVTPIRPKNSFINSSADSSLLDESRDKFPSKKEDSSSKRKSGGGKQNNNSRQTISPQSLSLVDFIKMEPRGNNKQNGHLRSPTKGKIKSSTPIQRNGGAQPRTSKREVTLSKKFALDNEDFPCIGGQKPLEAKNESSSSLGGKQATKDKRRIKPISLKPGTGHEEKESQPWGMGAPMGAWEGSAVATNLSAANATIPGPTFGHKMDRANVTNKSFSVAEVERPPVEDRGLMLEAASLQFSAMSGSSGADVSTRLTPFKATSLKTPNKLSTSISVTTNRVEEPSPEAVRHRSELDLLISLYTHIMKFNLMPNLAVELYFITELTLIDRSAEDVCETDSLELFASIHNCVYFGVNVLQGVVGLLIQLGQSAILPIKNNPRIQLFSQQLAETIEHLYDVIPSTHIQSVSMLRSRALQNVSFQSETDDRSNFPSNTSFHDFKKQRDKFYSMIRKWVDHPKGKEYNFNTEFGEEVDQVMKMHSHPANYVHFAHLFIQQMVAMCRGEEPYRVNGELGNLRTSDPVKYARLAARMITQGRCGGPCPAPNFLGAQEFFRDFVMCCRSHQFIMHLRNVIVTEVRELEGQTWDLASVDNVESLGLDAHSPTQDNLDNSGIDFHMGDTPVKQSLDFTSLSFDGSLNGSLSFHGGNSKLDTSDLGLIEKLQDVVLKLRILGKFLGFLEFLPFKDSENVASYNISEKHITIRESCPPSIDLLKYERDSEEQGRLVVTIPWLVEFLSQIDSAALSLNTYKQLCLRLVTLYQQKLTGRSDWCSPSVAFLLSAYLGWLFENDLFPRELFIIAQCTPHPHVDRAVNALDKQMTVPVNLTYQCCPWLGEIRELFVQWENSRKMATCHLLPHEHVDVSYRKITPVAAPQEKENQGNQVTHIQHELEENFLQNQPGAVRKTVDFLSERLASNLIRRVRQDFVPQERSKVTASFKYENIGSLSTRMLGEDSSRTVKSIITSILDSEMVNSIRNSQDLLLPPDTVDCVKDTCTSIVFRNVREKVNLWSDNNVTAVYFCKEYSAEIDRINKQYAKFVGINPQAQDLKGFVCGNLQSQDYSVSLESHNPSAPTPSHVLIKMKEDLSRLLFADPSDLSAAFDQMSRMTMDDLDPASDQTPDESPEKAIDSQDGLDRSQIGTDSPLGVVDNGLNGQVSCELEEADGLTCELAREFSMAVSQRSDITSTGLKGLEMLSVDWLVGLISFTPQSVSDELMDQLISTWQKLPTPQILRVLSPCMFHLLSRSVNADLSWEKMTQLLKKLLKSGLLPVLSLEDLCMTLLNQTWPEGMLHKLGIWLSDVRDQGEWPTTVDWDWVIWFWKQCKEGDDDYSD